LNDYRRRRKINQCLHKLYVLAENKKLSPIEKIKTTSDGLRGTLQESLQDEVTGAIREDDQALIKFHGMYQQDDRDRREERTEKKLEWLYSYMIRLRLPGGLMKADQWVGLNHIAGDFSTGVIKITTRQTIQLHGIVKSKIKPTISAFNTLHLDSIAACGDVNRNVVCSAHPSQSALHEEVFSYAERISIMALPKTRSYYEIWLNEESLTGDRKKEETDPLYQDRYLPRKFKIAIAIPPDNDVDVFANDIGMIAITENGKLAGFNIAAGGGLSTTHGNPATYPRLASMLGYVSGDERIMKVVYEIITIQRDYGNRSDRKLARLKYTIDTMGVDAFKTELEKRCGFALEPARSYTFTKREDHFGWQQDHAGNWYYTVFTENGLIKDMDSCALKTGLLEIAKTGKADFRFTCNQNLVLSGIKSSDKKLIESLIESTGIGRHTDEASLIRRNAIACVAFNTCPLALAEAQRYLPSLITKIEPLLSKYAIDKEELHLRMTGCPNGCGRPYVAEIGLIGTAYGKYNLHIGGDRFGERLNTKYKDNLDEESILAELDSLFERFSVQKEPGEGFGDFVTRKKMV
jgi:sulfite reductase (NADPH) hemoprotein beta-component